MPSKNKIGISLIGIIVLATIGYALVAGGQEPDADGGLSISTPTINIAPEIPAQPNPGPTNPPTPERPRQPLPPGRYADFSADRQSQEEYATTILFFYATWCPECRAFDQAIQSSSIPDGVQILRINYDENVALRQKYGVTIQTTFVSTASDGTELKKWVGYQKEKSVDAILQNVRS